MLLPGFLHDKGVHCGSTALRDVLRLQGCTLPEPLVFGLGAGLGFSLHHGDVTLSPPQAGRFFVGRSADFEQDLCATVGAELTIEVFAQAPHAWQRCQEHLADGVAPLLYTDLFHLPYLGAHGHWFGHLVAVAGAEGGEALLADNEREGLVRCPLTALQAAMGTGLPTRAGADCTVLTVRDAQPLSREQLAQAARRAIVLQALRLGEEAADHTGVVGLRELADELPSWRERADRQRCLRLAAQVIEVRGNGGGLFRRLYAQFLDEAAQLGLEAARALRPLCLASADAFTALAAELQAQQLRDPPLLAEAAERARACADAESALWLRALELFEP